MNYPFKNAVIDFVQNRISSSDFNDIIMNILGHYPKNTHNILMNFLSTHDTKRILSELADAPDMTKNEAAEYKIPIAALPSVISKYKLCICMQFTLPGMPCIYYGDEIAMQGLFDPMNREYFKWENLKSDAVSIDMYNFYKEITSLRKKYSALSEGSFKALKSFNNDLLIYKRVFKNDTFYIVINNSPEDIQMKCKLREVYNFGGFGRKNNIAILKKKSFTLFYAQK